LVAACGKDGEQAQQTAGAPAPTAPSTQPAAPTQAATPSASAAAPPESALVQYAQAGLPDSLIKDGCYSCHDVNGARIGPPLRAVAGLYRNDPQAVDKLTQKVIHGGSGVWGSTPMIAHPQLSEDQVRPMIEAILKLN
jgi:cytochrome c